MGDMGHLGIGIQYKAPQSGSHDRTRLVSYNAVRGAKGRASRADYKTLKLKVPSQGERRGEEGAQEGEGEGRGASRTPRSYLMFSCTLSLAAACDDDGPCACANGEGSRAAGACHTATDEAGIKAKKVTI